MASKVSSGRGSKEYMLVYSELITAARYRGLVTYQALAHLLGLSLRGSYMGKVLGVILGAISQDELQHGRPMLSALAVNVRGVPGPGFFAWARELGRFDAQGREAELRFWGEEREAVYAAWAQAFRL